ncbi:MAG: hypothetical protein ACOYOT_00245 [Bacteroidales bacterium]
MNVKQILFFLVMVIPLDSSSKKITNAFVCDRNIFLQDDEHHLIQITKAKMDTMPLISKSKKFMIYLRYRKSLYLSQIIRYDFATKKETILVEASENNSAISTPISYARSYDYPFNCLGEIEKIMLSPNEDRIYFQATAWVVSAAIHYYSFSKKNIYFFHAGDLRDIRSNGSVEVQVTFSQCTKGSWCRYWQDCLFDVNGKKIKNLGRKYS